MPVATDGFQGFVNNELPIGVAGDFAGANIRASVIAPPGGFVAAAEGVTIGCFAWGDPTSKVASNYYVPNALLGFVHRENQGLITNFLGISTFIVQPGHEITLQAQGDYLGIFASGATVGQKVYADGVTGALTAAATGQGVTANSTAASLATTGILTVGATLTGTLAPGQAVYATGIPPGSYIGSQLSGSTGSTGTYQLINANGTAFPVVSSTTVYFAGVIETPFYVGSNVPVSATFTASIAGPVSPAVSGIMTVSAVAAGVLAAGQFLSATGLAASLNVQILQQLTYTLPMQANGGGGTGTYLVSYTGSAAVTSTNTFVGASGQLGKLTSWST